MERMSDNNWEGKDWSNTFSWSECWFHGCTLFLYTFLCTLHFNLKVFFKLKKSNWEMGNVTER